MYATSVSAVLAPILESATLAFLTSVAVSALLVATRAHHIRLTGDSQLNLPQKIHREAVPRVGGAAIVTGFVTGLVHLVWFGAIPPAVSASTAVLLLAALLPIAIAGFGEDLTKRVGPRQRLAWMALGAAILIGSRHLALDRVDIPLLDLLIEFWPIALLFSVFACVGVVNAFNIVDGLNGLLAGVSLITMAGIAWVAATVGDQKVFALAVLLAVATLGWLPFNWPRARLFAGDGGAYSIGFLTAAMVLLLIHRNPGVSPWFGVTVAALPVWETLYSIWRRARTGLSTMEPDQSHLHQLVRTRLHWQLQYRALRRAGVWAPGWTPQPVSQPRVKVRAPNASCSPFLWALHATAVIGGAVFFGEPLLLASLFVAFALTYVLVHRWLLRARVKYGLSVAG
jgi:UDP-GlcNAc:undecaprenyl-phosphate GlcNAc-1-phosphate transferase